MVKKLSIRDLNLKNQRALIRVDFNVPMEEGRIADDTRIRAALPTIQYVLAQGGSIVLMSHLGRPKASPDPQFTLRPCAERLAELLQRPVKMAADCVGPEVEKMVKELQPGEVVMLENVRFHPGEENPEREPAFTGKLARLGDLYINDAFGTAHRAHASTKHIASFFPGKAAMGFLMEKEVTYLGSVLLNPKRPFCAVLGGSKISTKFKVIEALLQKADVLLIGGAMAFTFFEAQGIFVGNSLVENESLAIARSWLERPSTAHCRLLLPLDIVAAKQIAPGAEHLVVQIEQGKMGICEKGTGIPEGFAGVDIGPATIAAYMREIKQAATIFWNGPLGVFEIPPFDRGTEAIARCLAGLAESGSGKEVTTIIGGGDSVAAVERLGLGNQMSHVSTGGGAALEYIENGKLPGIEALS